MEDDTVIKIPYPWQDPDMKLTPEQCTYIDFFNRIVTEEIKSYSVDRIFTKQGPGFPIIMASFSLHIASGIFKTDSIPINYGSDDFDLRFNTDFGKWLQQCLLEEISEKICNINGKELQLIYEKN